MPRTKTIDTNGNLWSDQKIYKCENLWNKWKLMTQTQIYENNKQLWLYRKIITRMNLIPWIKTNEPNGNIWRERKCNQKFLERTKTSDTNKTIWRNRKHRKNDIFSKKRNPMTQMKIYNSNKNLWLSRKLITRTKK